MLLGKTKPQNILVIKLDAAGDVVRTTSILHLLTDSNLNWPRNISWLTNPVNRELIPLVSNNITLITKTNELAPQYDLIVSLEDDAKLLTEVFKATSAKEIFGTYINKQSCKVEYSSDMQDWFDMSLSSRFGISRANELKLNNRKSYQEHLYAGFGQTFNSQEYILPSVIPTANSIKGDIAFAPECGKRWPMKRWAYFDKCIEHFAKTCKVNVLQQRPTLSEHIADIAGHKLVVTNDSLPMHLALGLKKRCIAFFTCTSPWEIYGYNRLTRFISPRLSEFFYRRDFVEAAINSIPLETVIKEIESALEGENSCAFSQHCRDIIC